MQTSFERVVIGLSIRGSVKVAQKSLELLVLVRPEAPEQIIMVPDVGGSSPSPSASII